MITGAHVIIDSTDAKADRTFIRDVLGMASVDAGDGWLIFALPPAEVAIHPTAGTPQHELYLMCDDIAATVADLEKAGATFTRPATDEGWGVLTALRLPGGGEIGIYEPRHPTPLTSPGSDRHS